MQARVTRVATLAVVALLLGAVPAAKAARTRKPAACCFRNPGYAGGCRVTPAADESCAGILAYLNDPQSTGKTYCDSSDIRGGWTRVTCKAS